MFVSLPDILIIHKDAIFAPHEAHEPAKRTLAEPSVFVYFVYCFAEFRSKIGFKLASKRGSLLLLI